jgi:peptidoglycan LD-endopeptidase CwlK
VVIFCVLIYFVLVLSALAWWLLPPWRERVHAGIVQLWRAGRGAGQSAAGAAARSGGAQWALLRHQSRDAARSVRARSRTWLAALALLVVIPAAALGLRHWWAIDGFDHTYSREINPQVAALL